MTVHGVSNVSRTFIAFLIVLAALSVLAHCGHAIVQSHAVSLVQQHNDAAEHAGE